MSYPDTLLFIDGEWTQATSKRTIEVENPSTGEIIGKVARAGTADLDKALAAAEAGFQRWRKNGALEKAAVLRKAAVLIRERAEDIARNVTLEQGKPLHEARAETLLAGDILEWFAGEAQRTYGRIIPARIHGVSQLVVQEPVGPVLGLTPWNFPINQTIRKMAAALAAGCSILIKGPEETPSGPAALVQALHDAGLPAGVLGLVYGIPAEISDYCIPHPVIRKVSFTGSVVVGKQLAAMAGLHMKRVTMELGGHAPVIITRDTDVAKLAKTFTAFKFRAAGQTCISPNRFLVESPVYDEFRKAFVEGARGVKVGDGLDGATQMGPLVNEKRLRSVEALIAEAVESGARIETGGRRIGNHGYYFEPTILSQVTPDMKIMNDEPFGPIALLSSFDTLDEAIAEANRLPVGLGAYAFSRDEATVNRLCDEVETGMISVNHIGLALPEVPFGGIKDSGYGSEGGAEAIQAYLTPKFITRVPG